MTMLTKEEFVKTHPDVRVGMTAYSTDGARLGVIERIDEDNLTIERGWFFHKDFTIPYDDIEDIRDDRAIVRQRRKGAEKGGMMEESEFTGRTAGRDESERGRATEEATSPVREEKLEAGRRAKESEVGIREEIRTETEQLEVSVQKEEASAERAPAEETTASTAGEKAVQEEEVEVSKRPAGKEEMRGRKESRPETKPVSGEARKEEEKVEPNKPAQKK
jgi:stress response protein YsnF